MAMEFKERPRWHCRKDDTFSDAGPVLDQNRALVSCLLTHLIHVIDKDTV